MRSPVAAEAHHATRTGDDPVRLRLPDAALGRLRVAPHALWDVLASVALLAHSRTLPQFPYRVWARAALGGLADGTGGGGLLRWAATWPAPRPPRFLLLPPRPGGSDLADGLRQLRQCPPEVIRDRLRAEFPDTVPAAFERFGQDLAAAVADLGTAIEDYHQVTLRPYGAAIGNTIEDEVRHRGQVLAAHSVDGLLGSLHPRIQWARPTLSIATDTAVPGPEPAEVVLVPLLFLRERVLLSEGPESTVCVAYQARGAANLAMRLDGRPEPEEDPLSVLLGRSRASVVRHLATPRTTTALAEILGLAPSTVSEHLALLVSSQAALRFRRANKVYYELSDAGRDLLHSFSGTVA